MDTNELAQKIVDDLDKYILVAEGDAFLDFQPAWEMVKNIIEEQNQCSLCGGTREYKLNKRLKKLGLM